MLEFTEQQNLQLLSEYLRRFLKKNMEKKKQQREFMLQQIRQRDH